MTVLYIFLANFLLSIISLVTVLFLGLKKNTLQVIVNYLVAFSVGTLLGGAFLHLIPEGLEEIKSINFFLVFSFTYLIFFILEKLFSYVHCHTVDCDVHEFGYLNLVGDFFHNFTDGIAITTSFLTSVGAGISTTVALVFHELPQEIGDFGVLVKSGFKPNKAILFNLLVSLSSLVGSILALVLFGFSERLSVYLLPVSAASMVYIATADLIPVLYKDTTTKNNAFRYILASLIGLLLMYLMVVFE